jgi:multidrug resistance efflux pump
MYAGATVIVMGGVWAASSALHPAAPTVSRADLYMDTVRRGEMVRAVRGPGTLVSEDIRWISAITQGRVESKLVQPGTAVTAGTVLLTLSNPDVERQALEAQRQLTAAEAELATLRSTLQGQLLSQQSTIAQLQAQLSQAERQAQAGDALLQQHMISQQEAMKARDDLADLRTRLGLERQRLTSLQASMRDELASQEGQITMLRRLAAFNQAQIASMQVRSPQDGVLQELPVELGQWVNSGGVLAKVVQPGRLKAVLRIPETQARDLVVGLPASIDTRNGIVRGRVARIDPAAQNGTVTVDVQLDGALPRGARPDLSVDGTVEIDRVPNAVYVGRPSYGQATGTMTLFRVLPGGHEAVRTQVRLGRSSASNVEVLSGLKPGDVVILSDMSEYEQGGRVRIE